MKRYETPSRSRRSRTRFRIAACTETSRSETGSSQMTSRGDPANERAIATRCFMPPDRADGRSCRSAGERRTSAARSCSAASPPLPFSAGRRSERRSDAADGHRAVERSVRILEDHLHGSARLPGALAVRPRDVAPVELERAGRRLGEARDAPRKRRLPAAGLAHEPEDLAVAEIERDVGDSLDARLACAVRLRDAVRREAAAHRRAEAGCRSPMRPTRECAGTSAW